MKRKVCFAMAAVVAVAAGRSFFPSVMAQAGSIEKPAQVTYSKDVAPLLADRCGMCHHAGGSAPFTLLSYADAKRHAGQIATVTANRFMPPWKADPADGPFVGQRPLADREILLLRRWLKPALPKAIRGICRRLASGWTDGN